MQQGNVFTRVCHSVQGGVWQTPPGRHPWADIPPRQTLPSRHPLWQTPLTPLPPVTASLQPTVRILLEWILVIQTLNETDQKRLNIVHSQTKPSNMRCKLHTVRSNDRNDNNNDFFAHFHVLFIKYNFVHNKNGGDSGSLIT